MSTEKTERVVLRVEEIKPGIVVMKKTTNQTSTLPFTWPSIDSAKRDLGIVVAALLKKGYTVVDENGEEVKA